jgi:nitroreductase
MINQLVEAAITAPSASNRQPWRFLIIRDQSILTRAEILIKQKIALLTRFVTPECKDDFLHYSSYLATFYQAPVVITTLYRTESGITEMLGLNTDQNIQKELFRLSHDSALMSVAMAMQNIALAAQALNLGTCILTGALIARNDLNSLFQVPDGWNIAAMIAVGFPAEFPAAPARKQLPFVIKWL